jgi:hypothetical protein
MHGAYLRRDILDLNGSLVKGQGTGRSRIESLEEVGDRDGDASEGERTGQALLNFCTADDFPDGLVVQACPFPLGAPCGGDCVQMAVHSHGS